MILALFIISLLAGMTSLAYTYLSAGLAWPGIGICLLGVFWLAAAWRKWRWAAWPGLGLATLAGGIGLFYGLSFGWVFPGLLGAFTAWDLDGLLRQMELVEAADRPLLERTHLARLGFWLLASLALFAARMQLNLRFTFEWTAILVLVSAWGIALAVRSLKRPQTPPQQE
jgi:hypothetical protein